MQPCISQTQQRIDRVLEARYRIADHSEEWPRILPALEKLAAMRLTDDWTPQGLRDMLDEEMLMLLVDESDPAGFALVFFDVAKYDRKEKELYIYLVWHQGGHAIDRFQPHLELFAMRNGAKHIRFHSPRRGLMRVGMSHGYQARSIEYVKELQP